MTQSKNSSLIQLTEVFPSWSQEDLLNVLNEAGGDVYVAISRISEGHVSQWSDSSKKTAMTTSFESRPPRTDRNNRREHQGNFKNNNTLSNNSIKDTTDKARNQLPRDRPQTTTARKAPAPVKTATAKTVNASNTELLWGESTEQTIPVKVMSVAASMVSSVVPDRPAAKTSFAEAAASALSEKQKKKKIAAPAKVEIEVIVKADAEVAAVAEEISVQEPELILVEAPVFVEEPIPAVTKIEIVEDEETVFMPARATPSLTMEQPAVVMPIRTNLRTNLTIRFGYDSNEEVASPIVAAVAEKATSVIEEIQPNKTPITVSALESTFAILSTSPAPPAKSPEPILTSSTPETSAWDNTRNSGFPSAVPTSGSPNASGYTNFPRGRQHGGWDYESPVPTSSGASNSVQGSFGGPAPGFSGPSAAPQRFVSRAAAQYEHANVYTPTSTSPGAGNTSNSRFSPYEETSAAGNNVSQYYTPAPHHQQAATAQQQSGSPGHYSPYSHHQSYLNNYHHGYPQYPQHADQYSQPQQPQQQQPYYQPYQPPNQYMSSSNMHHHNPHHHQNQHHNA